MEPGPGPLGPAAGERHRRGGHDGHLQRPAGAGGPGHAGRPRSASSMVMARARRTSSSARSQVDLGGAGPGPLGQVGGQVVVGQDALHRRRPAPRPSARPPARRPRGRPGRPGPPRRRTPRPGRRGPWPRWRSARSPRPGPARPRTAPGVEAGQDGVVDPSGEGDVGLASRRGRDRRTSPRQHQRARVVDRRRGRCRAGTGGGRRRGPTPSRPPEPTMVAGTCGSRRRAATNSSGRLGNSRRPTHSTGPVAGPGRPGCGRRVGADGPPGVEQRHPVDAVEAPEAAPHRLGPGGEPAARRRGGGRRGRGPGPPARRCSSGSATKPASMKGSSRS